MPSKKRKYNARFPAGRIKKIMQTDEEVGKVAQAVPIIISRTLELFVESLLGKAMQVTLSRNAKTLSPSHVKQCILAESRFDFLRDLVKNIPDVSAAEEKELMSAESSPNSSRYPDTPVPPRKVARQDSNSSSSSDARLAQLPKEVPPKPPPRGPSVEAERRETVTSASVADVAIDLTKRPDERPVRTANFYQETLVTDETQHRSVITVNPTYATPQPSTSASTYAPLEPLRRVVVPVPPPVSPFTPAAPKAPTPPVNPILNIDFSRNIGKPEIKVLDTAVASVVGVKDKIKIRRQYSKTKVEGKRHEAKPPARNDAEHLNAGDLQIDEDYDT